MADDRLDFNSEREGFEADLRERAGNARFGSLQDSAQIALSLMYCARALNRVGTAIESRGDKIADILKKQL